MIRTLRSKRISGICLAATLLVLGGAAPAEQLQITGARTQQVKLYSADDQRALKLTLPGDALEGSIAEPETGAKGWLRVKHDGQDYLIRTFQVKTDRKFDLSTQGGCDRISATAGGYGGNRGLDGNCPRLGGK